MSVTPRSRTALRASFVAIAILAFGGTVPASASDRLLTRSASVNVAGPSGTLGTVTARCPSGTRVISGGHGGDLSFHPNGSGTVLVVHTSRRVGRSAWRVSAYNIGIGEPLKLTATANCSDEIGPLRTRTRRITIRGGESDLRIGSARARCPRHSFALSGGFQFSVNGRATQAPDTPPVALLLGSRALARSWAVTVGRLAAGRSRMTSFAYCASSRPLARHRFGMFRAVNGPVQTDRLLSPRCPRGTFATSGGFTARLPMAPGRGAMIPISSGMQGKRRWAVTGAPQQGLGIFNSIVYCLGSDRPSRRGG